MARPKKRGLEYFPVDVDIFSDRKTVLLMSVYGSEGFQLYMYYLCRIYREGYFITIEDEDDFFIIASRLGTEGEKIREITGYMIKKGLFDKELFENRGILTSKGVQRRFQFAIKTRLAKTKLLIDSTVWLLPETETLKNIVFNEEALSKKREEQKEPENEEQTIEKPECENQTAEAQTSGEIFSEEFFPEKPEKNAIKKSKEKNSKVEESKAEESREKERKEGSEPGIPCLDGTFCPDRRLLRELEQNYNDTDITASLLCLTAYLTGHPEKRRKREAIENYIRLWVHQDSVSGKHKKEHRRKPTYDIDEFESYNFLLDYPE